MNVIILHGWMQNKKDWLELKKQFESIKAVNKVYVLDLPGFGEEKLILNDWGIPEYANWVQSEINKKKITNAVLFGHSFGGRIAAYLSSENPKWLTALILSGAPVLYRPQFKTKLRINLFKGLKDSIPESLKSALYSGELKEAYEKGMDKIFKKVVVFDQTNKIKLISKPTLLIWGENDDSVPLSIAREAKTLINNSKLEIIKSAGHNAYHSNPYLFFGHVKKFIENL